MTDDAVVFPDKSQRSVSEFLPAVGALNTCRRWVPCLVCETVRANTLRNRAVVRASGSPDHSLKLRVSDPSGSRPGRVGHPIASSVPAPSGSVPGWVPWTEGL